MVMVAVTAATAAVVALRLLLFAAGAAVHVFGIFAVTKRRFAAINIHI